MRHTAFGLLVLLVLAGCDGAAIVSRPVAPADAATLDAAPALVDVVMVTPLDASMPDPSVRAWLTGRAYDARNGEALEGVELVVDGVVVGRSDAEGGYSLTLPLRRTVLTARANGRVPFVREVLLTEAPTVLDVPLTAQEAPQTVTPAGATITTRQGVSLRFPADAVRAPTQVTATWLDGDAVAAVPAPAVVNEGEEQSVLRGALVVSDLVLGAPVRVEIPAPNDVLPASLSLRELRDGEAGERLDPVSTDGGRIVFEVPHFSAWGLFTSYPTPRAVTADCPSETLGNVWPAVGRFDMQIERGMQRIPISATTTGMAGVSDRTSTVPMFCGDIVRAPRQTDLRASGAFGSLMVKGEYLPLRISGRSHELTVSLLPALRIDAQAEIVAASTRGTALRIFPTVWLEVVAEGGSLARLRRIRCSRGDGWAVTHHMSNAEGRVLIPDASRRVYSLSAGAEALFCEEGATAVGRVLPAQGACALPSDCVGPSRCDPVSQRCVLPRGAACATGGPPCDDGASCFDAVCVAQTAPNADTVPCASDADCPDERCDLARRACRSPVTKTGARPCTARAQCGLDEDCSIETNTCASSTVNRCASDRECPEGTTCAETICVRPLPIRCIRDTRRAEAQQAQCPTGYRCSPFDVCEFQSCPAGEALCGGRCVRLDLPQHCGACLRTAAAGPNAVARCIGGEPVAQCRPGYGDCDNSAANGCEARLDLESACGACGVRCPMGQTCVGLRCSATPRSAVTAVAMGQQFACALHADGGVSCWGRGFGAPRRMAVRNAVKIAAGRAQACAVDRDGLLSCWDLTSTMLLPRMLEGVADVSLGITHGCAVLRDGSVRCWGSSNLGALGDGATSYAIAPVSVRMPMGVRAAQVVAGGDHSCLRSTDGQVWCWGRNEEGQLGDGTFTNRDTPVRVNTQGVSDLRAGVATTLALRDGEVLGWGTGVSGQLGPRRLLVNAPAVVTMPNRARAIAVAGAHSCAILVDGRVLCQGGSDVVNSAQPTAIAGLESGVASLELGSENGCAVLRSGFLACWGGNGWGLLTPAGALGRSPVARPLHSP